MANENVSTLSHRNRTKRARLHSLNYKSARHQFLSLLSEPLFFLGGILLPVESAFCRVWKALEAFQSIDQKNKLFFSF